MARFLKILRALLLVGIFTCALNCSYAQDDDEPCVKPKKVLYITSYSASYKTTSDALDGFNQFFEEQGVVGISMDIVELDVRTMNGFKVSIEQIEALNRKISSEYYDVIMTSSNPAADLFFSKQVKVPGGVPYIFLAYTAEDEKNIPRLPNSTGTVLPFTSIQNIKLAFKLYPHTKKIFIITGATSDAQCAERRLKRELAGFKGAEVVFINGLRFSTAEMLMAVASQPKDSLVLFHNWSSVKSDFKESMELVSKEISLAAKCPVFTNFDSSMGAGIEGGYMVVSKFHGRESARLLLRVISGESPDSIPLVFGMSHPRFDYQALAADNVDFKAVPESAVFINYPESMWSKYRLQIVSGLSVLFTAGAMGYLFLGFMIRRMRRWEQAFKLMPIRCMAVDKSGNVIFFKGNDTKPNLEKMKHLDDAPADAGALFKVAAAKVFESGEPYEMDYEFFGRRRKAIFRYLPENIFGVESVMWCSLDIDEVHKSKLEMGALAARFRLTIESIGDAVIATDEHEVVTLANSVASKLTGYSSEELVGKKLDEVFNIVSYLDESRVNSPVTRALATGQVVELANHTDLIAKDGARRHIADSAAPIKDEEGRISGAVLVFRDVTEEYRKRDETYMQNRILHTTAEIGEMTYFRCDFKGNILDTSLDGKFWGVKAGRRMSAAEWVHPEDFAEFMRGWDDLIMSRTRSMKVRYRALSKGRMRHFEMCVERTTTPATGIDGYFGVIKDITQIIESQQKFLDASELLRNIIDNIPSYVFVKDAEDGLKYILFNDACEKLLGRSREDMQGKTDFELLSASRAAEQRYSDETLLRSGAVHEDVFHFRKDGVGQKRTIKLFKKVVEKSGGGRLIVGLAVDITKEIELSEKVKESNELLNLVIDNLPCSLWIKNCADSNRYMLGNAYYEKMLGLPRKEFIGKTDFEFLPEEAAGAAFAEDSKIVSDFKESERYETLREKTGKVIHIRTRKIPLIHGADGGKLLLGLSFDVTELVESRNRLRQANTILQSIMDNLPAYIAAKDIANDYRYVLWNKTAERMTGIPTEFALGKRDADLECFSALDEKFRRNADLVAKFGYLKYTEEFTFKKGEPTILNTHITKVDVGDGGALLLVLSQDVTQETRREHERKKLLNDLKNHAEQERMINVALESAVLNDNYADALRNIISILGRRMGADRCHIFRFNYEGDMMEPFVEWHSENRQSDAAELPHLRIDRSEDWFKDLLQRRMLAYPEVSKRCVLGELGSWSSYIGGKAEGGRISSLFGVGVWGGEKLWGCLTLSFEKPRENFTPQEEYLLKSIAHIIEIILSRKAAQEELLRSEYEKRLIMDTIKIPILLFDPELKLVSINNAAREVSGIGDEQIFGRPCHLSFCGFEERPDDCPVLRTSADLRNHTKKLRIKGRDYIISSYPIFIDGKLVYILKTLLDVTEFDEVQRRLAKALKQAQSANKAKSYFLATMSHELRTPLNAVIGFSELLQNSDVKGSDRAEYVNSINLAGKSLLNLINDVLDLSKIEAEQMEIVPQPTDICLMLREIGAIFEYKAKEKDIELIVECPQHFPILQIDSLRFRQVALNLVGNALKFTSQGSVRVSVEFEKTADGFGRFIMKVKDTGIGISDEFKEKIFEPFVQQRSPRGVITGEGTGLGLTISQRLITKMGGLITFESKLGSGSTFKVCLEKVPFEDNKPTAEADSHSSALDKGAKPLRALLVDDVPMNLKVLDAMFKRLGIETALAVSGEEALEIMGKGVFDAVFTDMWMDGMNGSQLARSVKLNPAWDCVRVVAVTADTESNANFDMQYFDSVLLKPITLAKLRHTLSGLYDGAKGDLKS